MQTEMFMKDSGIKTKLMVKAFIFMVVLEVLNMQEVGSQINNMDQVVKNGQMAQYMLDNMCKELNKGRVILDGQMDHLILENYLKML